MKMLLVLLALLLPLPLLAATYQWTDERGTVNFADNLGQVPRKYWKSVTVITDDSGTPQVTEIPEPEKTAGKSGGEPEKQSLWDGKDEAWWRREFSSAREEIKAAQSDIDALKGQLADTSHMSRSEYIGLNNSLRHDEFRMKELRKNLDQLKERAAKARVPAEFCE